jgi:hypothetical protein
MKEILNKNKNRPESRGRLGRRGADPLRVPDP